MSDASLWVEYEYTLYPTPRYQSGLMAEAARRLTLSEAGSGKRQKNGNGSDGGSNLGHSRFPPGLEWEILVAGAAVMLGLTRGLRYVSRSVYRSC